MRLTILRFLIIGLLFLLLNLIVNTDPGTAILLAFVLCYILEPLIVSKT